MSEERTCLNPLPPQIVNSGFQLEYRIGVKLKPGLVAEDNDLHRGQKARLLNKD